MSIRTVNETIDLLVRDAELVRRVVLEGPPRLVTLGLNASEAAEVADAVRADGGREPFANLRRAVRFEPLFAAASASATKIG
jgi:hypothetical protein